MQEVKVEITTTDTGPYLARSLLVLGAPDTLTPDPLGQHLIRDRVRRYIQRFINIWEGGAIKGLVGARVVIRHECGVPHLHCWISTTPQLFDGVKNALFSQAAQESGAVYPDGSYMSD